jgi:hypothetical protein
MGSRAIVNAVESRDEGDTGRPLSGATPGGLFSKYNLVTMEKAYWLHILESKSPRPGLPSTYILARADAPSRSAGGAMPTVDHASWDHLSKKLVAVGVHDDVILETKRALDAQGSHAIPEVLLSQIQLQELGFTDLNQQELTLELMLDNLKKAGRDCGYMSDGKVVWIRGPGSPWTDTPTAYSKGDLERAISSGELRPQTMTGSATWTFYVLAK